MSFEWLSSLALYRKMLALLWKKLVIAASRWGKNELFIFVQIVNIFLAASVSQVLGGSKESSKTCKACNRQIYFNPWHNICTNLTILPTFFLLYLCFFCFFFSVSFPAQRLGMLAGFPLVCLMWLRNHFPLLDTVLTSWWRKMKKLFLLSPFIFTSVEGSF